MEQLLHNEKVKLILKIVIITVGIYLVFRFVLPLVWPIVIGYIIAKVISPVIRFLNEKGQFDKNLATVLVLATFIIVSVFAGFFLGKILISQAKNLAANWDEIIFQMDCQVKNICSGFEQGLKLGQGEIYMLISEGFSNCLEMGKDKVISVVMNNSVSAFIKMIEGFAAVLVAVMAAFFFLKDDDKISRWFETYPFAKETKYISDKLKFVFKAYLRAQLIIMLVNAVVCFAGFSIIKNPYSLILAIVVGLMDALPLLGLGVILVPWAVFCFIWGTAKNGIVLIVTFVICYILREILEPKLIGGKVGIPPITSLITIYAGYKLFGLIGVILGPVAYVTIKESLKVDTGNSRGD